jgi:hypothetical protein
LVRFGTVILPFIFFNHLPTMTAQSASFIERALYRFIQSFKDVRQIFSQCLSIIRILISFPFQFRHFRYDLCGPARAMTFCTRLLTMREYPFCYFCKQRFFREFNFVI